MTRSPFSVIIAGASALRYGHSGWGFRISESVCPETPGEQDCLVTSILPWEV